MIAFEKKIPSYTNFCHCSEGYIYEELASPLSMRNAAHVKHFI